MTQAAWRREAARRTGVDYATFLKAWKKPTKGAGVAPSVKPPTLSLGSGRIPRPDPKPPGVAGPGKVMAREEARDLDRKVAKELGLKPGTAASRKAAADQAGMRYDDFLATWKGKPNKPGPTGKAVPVKKTQTKPKSDVTDESPSIPPKGTDARDAYDAGWQASQRTTTYDMETAAARWRAKNPGRKSSTFTDGWTDFAAERAKYETFTPAPAAARAAANWDTLVDDVTANQRWGGVRIKPLDPKTNPAPKWKAQRAWMDDSGTGDWPYNPQIRASMGKRFGIEAHMPEKWGVPEKRLFQSEIDDWADSFIKAIERQKTTQPPLYRGVGTNPGVKAGDEFDLLPSSWSTDSGAARIYGDHVFAMKNSYGTSLNEAKINLDDMEVVAGGRLRVVEVREIEWEEVRHVWGETKRTPKKITVYVVEQLKRLP